MAGSPLVTVGLPVFNGEAFLDNAIRAILEQDVAELSLIISDNCSTDATQAICKRYAEQDQRVRYVRQQANLGPLPNFVFVLEQAETEYFMWAAADDRWSPDFIRLNLDFLRSHPEYVGSICPTHFEDGEPDPVRVGDGLLDSATFPERLLTFLAAGIHGNSAFYSLFRRDRLLRALKPIAWYLGFDWTVMLRLAKQGPLARLNDGWLVRGAKGMSSDPKLLSMSRSKAIHWLLPFQDYSMVVLRLIDGLDRKTRRAAIQRLVILNGVMFRRQAIAELRMLRARLRGRFGN